MPIGDVVEPELADGQPLPRPVKRRSSRKATGWTWFIVPLFVGLCLTMAVGSALNIRQELSRRAAVRAGTIKPASWEEWSALHGGASLPDDADITELTSTENGFATGAAEWIEWIGGTVLGTLGTAIFLGAFVASPLQQKRLVATGRAVRARVTDADTETRTYTERDKNGFTKTRTVRTNTVEYRYCTDPPAVAPTPFTWPAIEAVWRGLKEVEADGTVVIRTTVKDKIYGQLAPGAPVTVIYDPRRPTRHLLYIDSDYVALKPAKD